jgi:hypothetical protein
MVEKFMRPAEFAESEILEAGKKVQITRHCRFHFWVKNRCGCFVVTGNNQ